MHSCRRGNDLKFEPDYLVSLRRKSGDRLAVSRERARQLETNALKQLAQLREMEPLANQRE